MSKENSNLIIFINTTQKDLEDKIYKIITNKKIIEALKNGKRLRPILAMISFKTLTQGNEEKHQYDNALESFLVIELAHTASLVHDDIIDQDKERRGKPSLYVSEGTPKAFLIGHLMLALGLKIALKHGEKFARLYSNAWNAVVNGEYNQFAFDKNKKTKSDIFDIYKKIIEGKTASLFASSCKAGALKANVSDEIMEVLSNYGREIGIAYQLADDLTDLERGEMIDTVVVPLLNRLGNKDLLKNYKISAARKYFDKNKEKIKEIFIKEINEHVNNAEETAKSDIIPPSEYKDMLLELPKYIVNKILKEINISI